MGQVRHMVVLQFKPSVSAEQIEEIYRQIFELKDLIPGVVSVTGGPYSSPEGLNKHYGHGFLVTFENVAARDTYLPHPDHARVRDLLLANVDDAVAFDFEEK